MEIKVKKQVHALEKLKPKAITYKSGDNNTPISKEIYDEILEGRMDEILEMIREINYYNLFYNFKGSTPSISFAKFGGPVYTYDQLKNRKKTLPQEEEDKNIFKKI